MAIIGNPIIAAVKTEVDGAFDKTSTNPLQNRVIASWVDEPELTLFQDEDTKLVYISTLDGKLLGDGILVEGGGSSGGGTGGGTYTVKLTNLMDSRSITVALGGSAVLAFRYTSVDEDSMDDGNGVGRISVNGVQMETINVSQGDNTIDVSSILSTGSNSVVIKVENSEGTSRSLKYTVTVVSLSMFTTFNELAGYSGNVTYSYTITGAGTKTVHFVMDGVEIGSENVTTSGRSQSFSIPEQQHGGHVFEVYATLQTEGMTVRSNTLRHAMLWVDEEATVPAISSTFAVTSATQGETLTIPYIVYDPMQENAVVTLAVMNPNGTAYSTKTITVNRLPQVWYVDDYPAGNIRIRLSCGGAVCDFPITVAEHQLPVNPVTDSLALEFSASGRSNGEVNPAQWSYEDIHATFSGFGWTGADGWVEDESGATVLRFLPGDQMTIPFRPFSTDARETGYTIEVEMATRDVRDYESVVLSCMNGGRGVQINSQQASLSSEQSGIAMLFKEDARVRVAFSIENRNLNRLIYIYINGVMCGVTQYPSNDNFQQASPVGLTIGAEGCGLDLYKIRCYNKGLTRAEQLDNFIVDRSTLAEREAAAERNDILNEMDEVSIAKLPSNLSYIILTCPQLPQYKGDKKSGVNVTFVDQLHPERSWTASGVELDIQGTSSAVYPLKNYKIKLKQGITYSVSGETDVGFPIHVGEIPTKTICYKADYASSENANNIVLAKFYNDTVPYSTPPQESDSRVRQGIDGFSTTLFWQDSSTNNVTFLGKGNCNVDKGNNDVFGLTSRYPNAQSWEFLNNTSSRSLFKSDDFTSMGVDGEGNPIKAWQNDFEARYPEDSTDIDDFAAMVSWVVSTDRTAVNSPGEREARLQKFRNEFEDHFIKDAMIFYYLFTETFLMVDNRAKNMFMTSFDGQHWFGLPYDFDTAIGINNEGALVFEYNLEDTDTVGGADVFNGQQSVLWNNIRDAFPTEIANMYKDLRSMNDGDPSHESPFSYYRVAKLFTDHQNVWPEALWNEDAFIKYLQPYLLEGRDYLGMLQGNKASQRDWWLFNAFRYRDSKYQCGDASSLAIILRCYAVGDITITPYSHIYGRVKYGSYTTTRRCERNQSYVMECGLDQMNDTETYIYSADRIASVGDLSHLQIGQADFSAATKLQSIKIGDESANFQNSNLGTGSNRLSVGNNDLLESVNVANCVAFGTGDQKSLDLSGCTSIKTVTAVGTQLKGIDLPVGGHLQTLRLPASITNFTVRNQKNLQNLYFEGYGNLETLRVEGTPNVPIETLILENEHLNRVRLVDVEWTSASVQNLQDTYDTLIACGGMTASGANTDKAVVSGTVTISANVPSTLLNNFTENFPDLVIVTGGSATLTVRFRNWDGTLLDTQTCALGGSVLDPVASGRIQAPTRPAGNHAFYTYSGWDAELTNIRTNLIVTATFSEEHAYEVRFVNDDAGQTLLYTELIGEGQNATDPVQAGYITAPTKATDSEYAYTYVGWDSTLNNITQDKTIKARYVTTPAACVIFANYDNTELYRVYILRGQSVDDPITEGIIGTPQRERDTVNQLRFTYSGWDSGLTNIIASKTIKATYASTQYYVVTFKDATDAGGAVLHTVYIDSGDPVTDPVTAGTIPTPTRTPEQTYNYIYKGWDAPMAASVTQNIIYTAQYKTDRQFAVAFYNYDGVTLLDTQFVYDEDDALDPITSGRIQTPTWPTNVQYTYTFNGWDRTFTCVKSDIVVNSVYIVTTRQYTYRFLNNDNSVLTSDTVDYGTVITPPATASYIPANEDMEFRGWIPDDYTIVGDIDYTPIFVDVGTPLLKYLKGNMTDFDNSTATTIGAYAFANYTPLKTVKTAATDTGYYAFSACQNLSLVDFTNSSPVSIGNYTFDGCTKLQHLIIRSERVSPKEIVPMPNTPITSGSGTIYVPSELVDSYKSVWTGYDIIRPISAYPNYDFSTISDSWDEIVSNPNYATDYKIGDVKSIELSDGSFVHMKLIAFDTDVLANNTGFAHMTWISKFAPDGGFTVFESNTPAATSWPDLSCRAYLRNDFYQMLPSALKTNIKEVTKTYLAPDPNNVGTNLTLTTADTIWVPSLRELRASSTEEDSGVTYSYYEDDFTRRHTQFTTGTSNSQGLQIRVRSTGYVNSSITGWVLTSNTQQTAAIGSYAVYVIGFCT